MLKFVLVILFSAHVSHALRRNGEKVDKEISQLASQYGDQFVHASTCGGVLEGPAGVINYKLEKEIKDYETCVWTVRISKWDMEVELLEDGFGANQRIKVMRLVTGVFDWDLSIKGGDRQVYTVEGSYPVFQIVFSSSTGSLNSTGFSLLFKGVGDDDYSYSFKIFDQAGSTGAIVYPEVGDEYPKYQNMFFTIHPDEGKHVALSLDSYTNSAKSLFQCSTETTTLNLLITEVGYRDQHVVRYSECRNTTRSSTITSPLPLVVQYYAYVGRGNIKLSWEMVDLSEKMN